jgi:hypothetical protein
MRTEVAASEALDKVKEVFDFSVDKFPLSGPDGMATPWYGLFRSDTGTVVGQGSKTERYQPHQTDDVLALVEAAQEAFETDVSVDCHFRDGHYVSIAPTNGHRRSIFRAKDGNGTDNVFPRIFISAGYDGRAFQATMGYWRDLCSNLSMLKSIKSTRAKIRHTSKLRGEMNDLIRTFQVLKESWGGLTSLIDELEGRQVQMVDFLNEIYPQPAADADKRGITRHKNRTEEIIKRLQGELYASGREPLKDDFLVSAWQAYNAVQGYVQHDSSRRSNFAGQFDRIINASRDQAVHKAESLALASLAA